MSRKTIAKLAGFVGALGISAAMIAAASSATGAYFSDSVDGQLKGTAGVIDLRSGAASAVFSNLMPGEDQTATIDYHTTSNSANSDVWLVFTDGADYERFSGATGLGGYGHFKIETPSGSFESWNLASGDGPTCTVDADTGHGGQTVALPPNTEYCAVPKAIKLSGNLPANSGRNATITFGITAKADDQSVGNWAQVPFKLIATQVGIAPSVAVTP